LQNDSLRAKVKNIAANDRLFNLVQIPQTSLKELGNMATISTKKSRTNRIHKTPNIHKEINVDDLTVGTVQIEDYNPSGRFSELDYYQAPSLRIDRTDKKNNGPTGRLTITRENS
jgi:hypothetical protein